MKIIILGTNHIGQTLAENLAIEENDITLIGVDRERLKELQSRYDIHTITGHGSYPDVLAKANAQDTDMLLAVSDNDEVNMLACQVAYSIFDIPIKIARIRTKNYLNYPHLFSNESLPVDVPISPEQLVTDYVRQLIEQPGALQVMDFAKGKVQMVAVCVDGVGPMIDKNTEQLSAYIKKLNAGLVAIFRKNKSLPLSNETRIKLKDELFFIAPASKITSLLKRIKEYEKLDNHILIAGGGRTGSSLAESLEDRYHVKVIESNEKVAENISQQLSNTLVLLGDASDKELLLNENIDNIDVFCAMTNDDEANIIAGLQAKKLGAKKVIALVSRTAYVDLIEGLDIDIIVSPQHITISKILTYIRRGDIESVYSLRQGEAEAIEIIAHGTEDTSRVVGKRIIDLKFPKEVRVGAVIRNGKLLISSPESVIESDDHVVLFLSNKKAVNHIENLFQVKVGFFS
jgi:trk system potassium uptake protein TrkA